MGTNKNMLAVSLFTASLFLQQCSCTKTLGLDCAEIKYSFELPVKGYPDKDSISTGDTIWLEINESTSFKDDQSGQMIDYSNAGNIGSALGFQIYDSIQQNWYPAISQFLFLLTKGKELKRTPLDIEYSFAEETGRYLFKLGVIPKVKGLYRIVFSNSNNTYRNNDKCTKANFIINFKETNHNRHLTGYTGPDVPGGDLNFYVK